MNEYVVLDFVLVRDHRELQQVMVHVTLVVGEIRPIVSVLCALSKIPRCIVQSLLESIW